MATGKLISRDFTFSAAGTDSDELDIGDSVLVGLHPLTGWATGDISFTARFVGTDSSEVLGVLKFEGTALSFAAIAANEHVTITPGKIAGLNRLKLISSVSQSANQVVRACLRSIS